MRILRTISPRQEIDIRKPGATRGLSRRRFLSLSAGALLAAAFGTPAAPFNLPAASAAPSEDVRMLNCYNPHTREHLAVTYWAEGRYILRDLAEIYYFFRDFRESEYIGIDTRLINMIYDLSGMLKCREPFVLLSGYRTAKTNALLHRRSRKVAVHSYHIKGEAADISLPGCPLRELHAAAKSLKAGGVGIYPRKNYIHIDVGPVRYWRG